MGKLLVIASLVVVAFFGGALARPFIKNVVSSEPTVAISLRVTQFEGLDEGPFDAVLLGNSLTDHGRWAELTDLKIANRGIGRDTVKMIAARADLIPEGPVFVMAGINDLALGRAPDEVIVDIEFLLDQLSDRRIILQTVLGPENLPVPQLNALIEELALRRGIEFLDLTDDLGWPLEYTYDGIHLTAEGYRRWAARIEQQLGGM